MRDVQLTYQGIKPYFTYTNEVGNTEYFEYRLKVNDVSVLSNVKNYEVELLINPILNKERHHYALCSKNGNTETSIGLVFPISLLDGTEEIFPKGQLDYFLIAYYVLLQRLEHVDSGTFSQNFEDNICVCVFNMKKAGGDPHQLSKCIHSLREYNYSYFIDHNSYQAIEGYKDDWYVRDSQKNIRVQQQVPILYQEEMIDVILRALPSISNVVHRFFFLYQIIEYLIREIQKQEISKVIKKYENGNPENDFFDSVANIKKERTLINEIFAKCSMTESDCADFVHEVKKIYASISYEPDKTQLGDLFYSFRNQMTHSLRDFSGLEEDMTRTIFAFERAVMKIVERYPNKSN